MHYKTMIPTQLWTMVTSGEGEEHRKSFHMICTYWIFLKGQYMCHLVTLPTQNDH